MWWLFRVTWSCHDAQQTFWRMTEMIKTTMAQHDARWWVAVTQRGVDRMRGCIPWGLSPAKPERRNTAKPVCVCVCVCVCVSPHPEEQSMRQEARRERWRRGFYQENISLIRIRHLYFYTNTTHSDPYSMRLVASHLKTLLRVEVIYDRFIFMQICNNTNLWNIIDRVHQTMRS